jgi:hypothetical protein
MNNIRIKLSDDFYEDEFQCKHCGILKIHPGFISRLQRVRDDLHTAMAVTSGCRCKEYNR